MGRGSSSVCVSVCDCLQPHYWTSIDQSQVSKQTIGWYSIRGFFFISNNNVETSLQCPCNAKEDWLCCRKLKKEREGVLDSKKMLNKVKKKQNFSRISSASRLQKPPLAVQATLRRVCTVWWAVFFFFLVALIHFSLCATGDHHIKTPLLIFSAPEAASFSKDMTSFSHDQSGPAGEPAPCPTGLLRDWWGRGGGGS